MIRAGACVRARVRVCTGERDRERYTQVVRFCARIYVRADFWLCAITTEIIAYVGTHAHCVRIAHQFVEPRHCKLRRVIRSEAFLSPSG